MIKDLRPTWQARRIQMIFPLTGSDRRGLVSVEAKKWHGKIRFKLLALDVGDRIGREEQRIYLEASRGADRPALCPLPL